MFSGSWNWGEVQELDFDKDAILEENAKWK
jgi:hypothetical protein